MLALSRQAGVDVPPAGPLSLAGWTFAEVGPAPQRGVAIPAVDLAVAVDVGAHAHHAAVLVVLPAIGLPALGRAARLEIALGAQRLAAVEEDLGVDLAVALGVELLAQDLTLLEDR